MRLIVAFCILLVATSCAEQVARRPITQKSGSYIKESVQRNLDLIAQDEKAIENIIKKDTSNKYISSPNGFWYTYIKKNDSIVKATPKVGDLVLFTYDIAYLNGKNIITQEEIGEAVTQIDQSNQELISGIRDGLKLMEEGETVLFLLPSHKAYGYYGLDDKVGSNTPIRTTVTLLEIKDQTKN